MPESTAIQPPLKRTDSQSTYTSFRDKMSRALSPNARAHQNDGPALGLGARRPSIGRKSLSSSYTLSNPVVFILFDRACRYKNQRKAKEALKV